MNTLHNTKIYVNESNYENKLFKSINNRSNYLDNKNIKNINNKIKHKDNMLFLGNDITESLIFENSHHSSIYIYIYIKMILNTYVIIFTPESQTKMKSRKGDPMTT
jgi:hypothetical protein